MSILLVSFSTKFLEMVPWMREGQSLLGTDIMVALGFVFYSVVQGWFFWVDIPKCDLIQLTAVGAESKICLALDILKLEFYFPLNQDQASS